MFAECTIQYDTKKGGDIYVFVEKQIRVAFILDVHNELAISSSEMQKKNLLFGEITPLL